MKNPFWPGSAEVPQAKLDGVHFLMLDEPAQLAEYEAGNLDNVRDVPLSDLDRIKVDPVLGPGIQHRAAALHVHVRLQFHGAFRG